MNGQEGISLAKMAISVLLLCLLISAVMMIWYLIYGAQNKQITKWQRAVETTAAERLQDLHEQTATAISNNGGDNINTVIHDINQFPLTTNVSSAVAEFGIDQGLIFVSVADSARDTIDVFTFEDINGISDASFGHVVGVATKVHQSDFPMDEASSYLLKYYSDTRCAVTMINVEVATDGTFEKTNDSTFLALSIQILNK